MAQHAYVGALLAVKQGLFVEIKLPHTVPWDRDGYYAELIRTDDVLVVVADDRESCSWRHDHLRCLGRLGVCWVPRVALTSCRVLNHA